MKLSGPNLFPTVGQARQFNELNLKNGQNVVGKIISLDRNEAVLELAGHTIQAKIECEPPVIGTSQTFSVSYDAEGRLLLKLIKNSSAMTDDNQTNTSNIDSWKTLGNSGNIALQKVIASALMKDNLPVTQENVTKIARYMQEFQSRYQQPVEPEVFSFMIARKWPMTSGTVLAAWINREPEVRDLLRKKLQETVSSKEERAWFPESILKLPGNVSEITKKLKLASELRISDTKGQKNSDPGEPISPVSGSNVEISKKLQWLLEKNVDIQKELSKELPIHDSTNLVPLLIMDSGSNIHECFIDWKKEKGNNSQNNTVNDQSIHAAIPTENMGIIHLELKVSSNGVQIHLRVVSEDIRQYLRIHVPEIKSAISKENVTIAVNVSDEEKPYSKAYGVDLWM